MHLLYLDESGHPNDPSTQFFVLAGFAVFERSTHWLESRINPIAARFRPEDPSAIEFHGSPMYSAKDDWTGITPILDHLGRVAGRDPKTGFDTVVRPDGSKLIVADLVDDGPEREKVMASLRDIKSRDDVDIIIALGMAKEGFDWVWCEHALTVGYRGSLTEIIQIIGRATRDAPGKSHAQFTNLIAEPDASEDRVVDAVNNMLKAIACSLLMEQVLAPNFKFRSKEGGDEIDGSRRESDIVFDKDGSTTAISAASSFHQVRTTSALPLGWRSSKRVENRRGYLWRDVKRP